MSRNKKIGLVFVAAFTVLCIAIFVVGGVFGIPAVRNALSHDNAQRVGASIADYTLPPGYSESLGIDVFVDQAVFITPVNKHGIRFTLSRLSTLKYSSEELKERELDAFLRNHSQGWSPSENLDNESVMIRGKPEAVTVYDTLDSAQRAAIVAFEGNKGFLVVQMAGKANEWDNDLMKSFLASIR